MCRVVLKLTPFRETPNVDLSIFRSPVCTFVISDTSASQRCVLGRRATPMAMFGQLKADIMLICYHIWGEQMRPNCLKYRQGRVCMCRSFCFFLFLQQFCNSERKVCQELGRRRKKSRRRRRGNFFLSVFLLLLFRSLFFFFNVGGISFCAGPGPTSAPLHLVSLTVSHCIV